MVQEWQYEEKDRPQHSIDKFGRFRMQSEEPVENLVTWVYEEGSYVPVAKIQNGERYTIISDYMGRPVEAYNSYGNVVWQADYDIYGDLRNIKGIRDFIPFRQLGQYEDDETRLYYNRFRYYDPRIGNYISQDPIRLMGNNPTLYGYVGDCNKSVDLFGLQELGNLVQEAHLVLDPIAQKHKTTAIGIDGNGKIYIASSDEIVPRVQREWANSKGIEPIRGVGHAEETLMNANKNIIHIDASRKVCLDCENMMQQCHVTTDTEKSGRRSRNRLTVCDK